jgi:hypothetical protein
VQKEEGKQINAYNEDDKKEDDKLEVWNASARRNPPRKKRKPLDQLRG